MIDWYSSASIKQHFGEHFCGPDTLPRMENVLVAHYDPLNLDGYYVDVYAFACPATFYRIEVKQNGILLGTINTGSGQHEYVIQTAYLFADGMLAINKEQ